MATFDNELTLIKTTFDKNQIGDPIETIEKTTILCSKKSITRSEHYAAAAHGFQPEIVFEVNRFEYDEQTEIEFEGKRYNVIRAYEPAKTNSLATFETVELVCQGAHTNG